MYVVYEGDDGANHLRKMLQFVSQLSGETWLTSIIILGLG